MRNHDNVSLTVRSILSLVALLGLLFIEFKSRTECVATNLTVYLILGGTVMGLNGKEFAEVMGIFRKK